MGDKDTTQSDYLFSDTPSAFLCPPMLVCRYDKSTGIATLALDGQLLNRDTWELLKRRVDRLYTEYTDIGLDLINAEAREHLKANRRVVARETEPGFVYVMEAEGRYKIGRAQDVTKRLGQARCYLPTMEIVFTLSVSDMRFAERFLHEHFKSLRMQGEWFNLSPADLAWIGQLTAEDFRL